MNEVCASEEREIYRQLGELEQSIGYLSATVSDLSKRLDPIKSKIDVPVSLANTKDGPEKPISVIASRIRAAKQMIETSSASIHELMQKIEL